LQNAFFSDGLQLQRQANMRFAAQVSQRASEKCFEACLKTTSGAGRKGLTGSEDSCIQSCVEKYSKVQECVVKYYSKK
jgi:hypothetical protein